MNEIYTCSIENELYPAALLNMPGEHKALYYRGNIGIVNEYRNVAVIGSRNASEEGMELARYAGRMAANIGINVVNGLALGCDTAAIKGALAVGGRCIAIMPCGLEQIQPRSNQKLAEEILEKGGCLISEYPMGTAVQKFQYVERDRLQSGISQAVLIVEAEQKSGTMHTAEFARRQYKRLACYASNILKKSSGNRYLEKSGNAHILHDEKETAEFFDSILKTPKYEQLSLL